MNSKERILFKLTVFALAFLTFSCAIHNDGQKPKQSGINNDASKEEKMQQLTNKNHLKIEKYRTEVASHVYENWIKPETSKCDNQTTGIKFTILPDGSVSNVVFKKKSQCKELDDSIFSAVMKSVPFPSFPKGIYMKEVKLAMNFVWEGSRPLESNNDSNAEMYRFEATYQVHENWIAPENFKCAKNSVTKIAFTIVPNGDIKDLYFKKKSECKALNDAAFSAITRAAPFQPFPKNLNIKEVTLTIDLTSNGVPWLANVDNSKVNIYRVLVAYQVQAKWIMPENSSCGNDEIVAIVFTVVPDGNVKDIFFTEESGCKAMDDAALSAIKRAAPFRPFPKNLNVDSVELGIRFSPKGVR